MVSLTNIMLKLHLLRKNSSLISLVISYICKTFCVEFWKYMISGNGRSYHSSVGIPIMILHDAYLTFSNVFCSPLSGGLFPYFYWFMFLNFLHPLWFLSDFITHSSFHSILFLRNNCRWCGQGFFEISAYGIFSYSSSPFLPCCANISWFLTP